MKTRSLLSALAGIALSIAASGCSSSGGACGVAPCGGDVVGSWQAKSACIDKAELNMGFLEGVMDSCPTASLGAVTTTPAGWVTFSADMTFTGTLVVNSTIDINFPAACISGATCAELTVVLQTTVGSNGVTSATCAGSGSCVCTLALTTDSINASGTWTASGTTLALTRGDAVGNQPYCAQSSSLHLLDLDLATMMKVVGAVALSKQ